jgi:hypothetical protein
MRLAELRELCVNRFPQSRRRPLIMGDLEAVVARLCKAGIVGDLWINGSFLTLSPEPEDADLLLRVSYLLDDEGTPDQQDALVWFGGTERWRKCQFHLWKDYPDGHAYYSDSEWMRDYWSRWFGFSVKDKSPKGIALLSVPEVTS